LGFVRKPVLAPTVAAAFVTLGGVAYARKPPRFTTPWKIELCVQAGTHQLIRPGGSGCRPGDTPLFLCKTGPKTPGGLSGGEGGHVVYVVT
jgi:hypothetical protein